MSELADEHGAKGGAVGYEGSFESIAPASIHGEPNAVAIPTQALIRQTFATERLDDFTETLKSLRAIKTPDEIELITRTNEIAAFGLEAFKEHDRRAVRAARDNQINRRRWRPLRDAAFGDG